MKIILIIVLVYYGFKFLSRWLIPFLIKRFIDKMAKRANQFNRQEPDIKEGETIIEKKPKTPKKTNKNVGEYIDFEEL